MATATPDTKPVNKVDDAVHDRVVCLSIKADGTPDQNNPELIGDKDVALDIAKTQFAQQAVAAVDERERAKAGNELDLVAHAKLLDKVKADAEKRAEAVVNDLHKG
jgi:predicted GTPase